MEKLLAKERIENLTVGQIAIEIESGDVLLVDLLGADPTFSLHRPEFDPDRRFILHCGAGRRSALAADTLQQVGSRSVAHMASMNQLENSTITCFPRFPIPARCDISEHRGPV